MIAFLSRVLDTFKDIFRTDPHNLKQFLLILVVGLLFIGMPQSPPIDWEINTKGFWSNIPNTYLNNRNFVYPPWGLILLIPYYLMRAEGARFLSVLTIGWLTYKRKWPLSHFFIIVLSPYFLTTMSKSNMDIMVIILPILAWDYSEGKQWKIIARGLAFSFLLLKPQCTILIMVYLLWMDRKNWKSVLIQLTIVAIIIIPISLIGSPSLISQWLNNIVHPSVLNQSYWSVNNISLTAKYGLLISLGIMLIAIMILLLFMKARILSWRKDQTIATLLLISMYLLPYTSQQSLCSGLAFIPSLPGFFIQWFGVVVGLSLFDYHELIPIITFTISFLSLLCS